MGFYGVFRFLSSLNYPLSNLISFFQAVSLFGALVGFLLSLSSDDMNNSVAYSSISHINFSLGSFLFPTENVLVSSWVIMLAHGMIASILFWMVTVVYQSTSSRSFLVSNGSMSNFPEVQVVFFSMWIMNISPPPFYPFLGEAGVVTNLFIGLGFLGCVLSFGFIILGTFFSVVNYFIICHSQSKLSVKTSPNSTSLLAGGVLVITISTFLFFFPSVLLPLNG